MNILKIILSFSIILQSGVASATLYAPYQGSQWAKEHPGILPYSQCHLSTTPSTALGLFYDEDIGPLSSFSIGAIIGWDFLSTKQLFLNCVSDQQKLAYSIPMKRSHVFNFLHVGAAMSFANSLEFNSDAFNQKTVGDLFGKFKGYKLKLGATFFEGTLAGYKNEHEISVDGNNLGYEFGATANFGYSSYRVKPYNKKQIAKLLVKSGNNPYILTSNQVETNPNLYLFRDQDGDTCLKTQSGDQEGSTKIYNLIGISHSAMKNTKLPDQAKIKNIFHNGSIVFKRKDGTLVYQSKSESIRLSLDYDQIFRLKFVPDELTTQ